MATTTTKLIHLRPISTPYLPLPRHFSSSSSLSSSDPNNPPSSDPPPSKSSFSSYLTDVKASLNKHPPPPPPHHRPFQPRTFDPPPKISSLEQIQQNLSQFRRLSAPPSSSGNPISLPELYKRHVIPKSSQENNKDLGFTAIRESLKHLKSNNLVNDGPKLNQESKKSMVGGFGSLPMNIFGKEVDEGGIDEPLKREFCRVYNYEELGRKLMELRPEKKKDERNWFSLGELSERLNKLRVNDEEEMKTKPKTLFTELRASLTSIDSVMKKKEANITVQKINMLTNIGAEPDFMLSPPKEHLVDKYFHPDNMSSAEKLKIELKKVRDEFKMSESDCGSARVQVAQLTTKIKHLSTALHKKDKHSRKGLQAMVQQRKKLLKYLRRTDWDSYCLVLSKLGLRDNPDYKN